MGFGIDLRRRQRIDECPHQANIEVTTSGLTRMVCENCGHVTIQPSGELSGDIDRSRFGRRSERSAGHRRMANVDETKRVEETVSV